MRGSEGEEQEETEFTIKELVWLQLCSEPVLIKVKDGTTIWKISLARAKMIR